MHEMSGNEDVFRFQEESVLFLVVVSDANSDPHHSRPSKASTAQQ